MYKIGILYICTGKYAVFWKDFYESVRSMFLPETEKHYFVITDSDEIFEQAQRDTAIHCYYQETEEWPFPTLKRFEYFLRAGEELKGMDYLMFMNGNLRVNRTVNVNEILPMGEEDLFVTLHPGFYDSKPRKFAYDHNRKSLAYIKNGRGEHYFAGGFNGGKTDSYLEMVKCLADRVNRDLDNGIIAVWHDESHLNRYMYDYDTNRYKILSPAYLYPEGWNIPFEEVITVRDKNKLGGHDYLRS